MKIEFAFEPVSLAPADLPHFEDHGEILNVAQGPDVELLKEAIIQKMPMLLERAISSVRVLATKRTWEAQSSFICHHAIVQIVYKDEIIEPGDESNLYLITLKGRLRATFITCHRISSPVFARDEDSIPLWLTQARPLPSAYDLRMSERYPDRHPLKAG